MNRIRRLWQKLRTRLAKYYGSTPTDIVDVDSFGGTSGKDDGR